MNKKIECVFCDRRFETKQGLQVHCGRAHPGKKDKWKKRTEVKCSECGELIEKFPSLVHDHNFCSKECMKKWLSKRFSGKDNPSWKGKEIIVCEWCGDEFEVKPSCVNKRRFCSVECKNSWWSEKSSGEGHFRYNSSLSKEHRQKLSVSVSGFSHSEEFKVFMSERMSGKSNPAFKDWASKEPYGKEWSAELKDKVRKRDNYRCNLCGLSNKIHRLIFGRQLAIHHVDRNKKNCAINNLLTVCYYCHARCFYD